MVKYILIKGRRYYYYDDYENYNQAKNAANKYKRKYKNSYFIISTEKGFMFPEKTYKLYMTKVFTL